MFEHWDWTWAGHSAAISALVGVLAGLLTPLAALLTCAWMGVQLYECAPMKRFLQRRRVVKLARLKVKATILEALLSDKSDT